MKKLFITILFIYAATVSVSLAQQKSYIIPDIGSPGMNIYIEIIAPFDSLWFFGNESVVNDSSLYLTPSKSADIGMIQFSPLYVSWSGRLISAQAFISPKFKPTSSNWNQGIKIPLDLVKNETIIGSYDFYVVKPFSIGNADASKGYIFGEGGLGIRSPRGAMIIDSMISTLPNVYTVSTKDCDPNTDGNQGYLPFILISQGRFIVPNISVDADGKDGGPGGAGGGGSYEDNLAPHPALAPYPTDNDFQGGNGFTGGGAGGINFVFNNSLTMPIRGRIGSGGIGSGSLDNTETTSYAGSSLNGVRGSFIINDIYQSAGGGTGHPFGYSGREYDIDEENNIGGYGGGSSETDNMQGGNGSYASSGNINDGKQHGNKYLMPLAGGSGGASGNPKNVQFRIRSGYGGGGGGAIAITAPIIRIDSITANGAEGGELDITEIFIENFHKCDGGHGSGGAIILNGKTETTIGSAETKEGSKTLNDAGYIRYSGMELNIPESESAIQYVTESTNTLNAIYAKNTNYLSGATNPSENGQISIYYKSEKADVWQKFADVNNIDDDGKWSIPIEPSFWEQSTDTLYYFYTLKNIPTNNDADLYAANPKNILTQSSANVITLLSDFTFGNADTIQTMKTFAQVSNCYTAQSTEPFYIGPNPVTFFDIVLKGEDAACFTYTSNPDSSTFPITLPANSNFYISFTYNTCSANQLGPKKAYIEARTERMSGPTIWIIEISYEVVLNFDPTPLDFGFISLDSLPKDAIKRVSYIPTSCPANITDAWLKYGYDFSFDRNDFLSNGKLGLTQINIDKDIQVSCIATSTGLKIDTLYFVVDNSFCEDTIAVPIIANITGGTVREDTTYSPRPTIAICGDSYTFTPILFPINYSYDFAGDTLVDTSLMYVGNNIEARMVNDINFPHIIESNNYNNEVTIKSVGRDLGVKEAIITFYVNRTNGTMYEMKYTLPVEVIIPISISPASFDFGTTAVVEDKAILTNIHWKNWNVASSRFINNKYAFTKDFSIVPAMGSDTAMFHFVSTSDGNLDDTLEVIIEYPECFDTLLIPITGKLLARVELIISIDKYVDIDPKNTNFPIRVYVESTNIDFDGGVINALNLDLINGYSLFFVKSITNNENPKIAIEELILGQDRHLTITDITIPPLKINEKRLLFNLVGDVLLGIDTIMYMQLPGSYTISTDFDYAAIMLINSSMTIIVCEEGSDRLLQLVKGPISTQSVNPATNNTLEVKCKVRQVGHYYLEIVDNTGNSSQLQEWNVANLENTEYTFTIDLTMFSNGNYYLRLRNNNEQAVLKLIIAR